MNSLQKVFNYNEQQVRTLLKDGEPWFVAKDVCEVLEFVNPNETIKRLEEDEVNSIEVIDSMGRKQITNIVNEPGLYSLILGSRKPEAKSFKRWITHEVIPSIRKTGAYSVQPTSLEDLIILQAQSVKELKTKVALIEEKTIAAHQRIDTLDSVNTIGDLQQRLNAMIRKYAQQEGLSFSRAWQDFIQSYNNAYRTNLNLLKSHYKMRNNVKDLTTPKYLSLTDKLMDAVRVADKLINKTSREAIL